jgi:hypothetical protein
MGVLFLGKKLLVSIFLIICFVVSVSGCTGNDNNPNNQGVNKTFTNQIISFQYPGNLTVTDQSALNSVNIETGNTVGANSGISIQVMNKTEYTDAVAESKTNWQLKGQNKTVSAISYSVYTKEDTYNGTTYTMNDYLFEKNGTFYDMFGNIKDANIMEGLIDSINSGQNKGNR